VHPLEAAEVTFGLPIAVAGLVFAPEVTIPALALGGAYSSIELLLGGASQTIGNNHIPPTPSIGATTSTTVDQTKTPSFSLFSDATGSQYINTFATSFAQGFAFGTETAGFFSVAGESLATTAKIPGTLGTIARIISSTPAQVAISSATTSGYTLLTGGTPREVAVATAYGIVLPFAISGIAKGYGALREQISPTIKSVDLSNPIIYDVNARFYAPESTGNKAIAEIATPSQTPVDWLNYYKAQPGIYVKGMPGIIDTGAYQIGTFGGFTYGISSSASDFEAAYAGAAGRISAMAWGESPSIGYKALPSPRGGVSITDASASMYNVRSLGTVSAGIPHGTLTYNYELVTQMGVIENLGEGFPEQLGIQQSPIYVKAIATASINTPLRELFRLGPKEVPLGTRFLALESDLLTVTARPDIGGAMIITGRNQFYLVDYADLEMPSSRFFKATAIGKTELGQSYSGVISTPQTFAKPEALASLTLTEIEAPETAGSYARARSISIVSPAKTITSLTMPTGEATAEIQLSATTFIKPIPAPETVASAFQPTVVASAAPQTIAMMAASPAIASTQQPQTVPSADQTLSTQKSNQMNLIDPLLAVGGMTYINRFTTAQTTKTTQIPSPAQTFQNAWASAQVSKSISVIKTSQTGMNVNAQALKNTFVQSQVLKQSEVLNQMNLGVQVLKSISVQTQRQIHTQKQVQKRIQKTNIGVVVPTIPTFPPPPNLPIRPIILGGVHRPKPKKRAYQPKSLFQVSEYVADIASANLNVRGSRKYKKQFQESGIFRPLLD
jgi:hypothetical protein